MKKSAIPDTQGKPTPAFVSTVKETLEVICGRRDNRITLPTMQTLTFSASPTKEECDALNAYVNAWAAVAKALVLRLDE